MAGDVGALLQDSPPLFKCYKLFEVKESSPVAGEETPLHSIADRGTQNSSSHIAIELCCYKETNNYSILALVCNNGYIVIRMEPFLCPPIIRQLKWFEGREQHILGITFDPLGEWLACACLDGCVYLIPALTLMMPDCFPSHRYGPLDDIVKAEPVRKVSPPTTIVWWESIDGSQICITGSELGEITFFNMYELKEISYISVKGCIYQLLLALCSDSSAHLLINLRGGEWWWILLEERYHEAIGTSYDDVQADGFEVVFDDAVLRSILVRPELTIFEPKLFDEFTELTKLSTQEWKDLHMLGVINLKDSHLELYSYNFDINTKPIRSFKVCDSTTDVLLSDRLIFSISHNPDDDYNFMLSILSRELAQRNVHQLPINAIVQQFQLPIDSDIIGFFITALESRDLASESRELTTPTNLGGCTVITSTAIYQLRQQCSPESLFLKLALSDVSNHVTDEVAIKFKLDICGLYKIAADYKLSNNDFKSALKLFQQSKTSAIDVIQSFISKERIPELITFLQEVVYDESTLAPASDSKLLQNVLLKCFVHQLLETSELSQYAQLKDSLTQFINDKFLYDHKMAMQILIHCNLIEQLIELAKTHHKIPEVLEMLLEHCSTQFSLSTESMIVTKQFAMHLATTDNGIMFYQLNPVNVAKCVILQPMVLQYVLTHFVSILPNLDSVLLTRIAHLLDPSHSTIQPLLQIAHSSLTRSSSTGSLLSVLSTESTASTSTSDTSLSVYKLIETFLYTLIILQHKRNQQTPPTLGMLKLVAEKVGHTPEELVLRPLSVFADGLKVLTHQIVSCGVNHAALIINEQLYTWGSTRNGKLGHGEIEQQPIAAPLRVEMFSMLSVHVTAVSCGAEHVVALCQEGVYSWGSSTHGQLGLGDTLKRSRPVQIASLANVAMVTVVSGHYHCLALDENHNVWAWGWGIHGQLGLGTCDDTLTPTHVNEMDQLKVSVISAGFNHSAVISHLGQLYTFGNGMYGQLGHGDQDRRTTPCIVDLLKDKVIYLVSCGSSHTVAVCIDQSVYHWGKNLHKPHPGNSPQSLKHYTKSRREGATSPAIANALLPVMIQGLNLDDVIIQVDCGNSHCILLLSSGTVLSWGSNIYGQIGHTHIPELSQPKCIGKLENHKIMTLSCGDEFTIGIDDSGISWVWGRGDCGQLGMEFNYGIKQSGKKNCIFVPNPNPQIPQIHCRTVFDKAMSPDQGDDSLLHIDLAWNLPVFSTIGNSYGRQALSEALKSLHGYYRSLHVISYCKQWSDWSSLIEIFTIEKQWSRVLEWSLYNLSHTKSVQLNKAVTIVDHCLSMLTVDRINNKDFIVNTSKLLQKVIEFWLEHKLSIVSLENILIKYLSTLSYSLNILIARNEFGSIFSFKFTLNVTFQVISEANSGTPSVEQLLSTNCDSTEKLLLETSPGDLRLWNEVLHNLFKDLPKRDSLTYSGPDYQKLSHSTKSFFAFTCGHVFTESEFQRKILSEFREKLEDLPHPLPQTSTFILQYYKHCTKFSSGCPYCVFQSLRQTQLKYSPGVPIRPWNP